MAVTGSVVLVLGEELLESERLSRSSIHCTVWAAALTALATAWDGVDFRSLSTVANADWAEERLPEPMALPSAAMSVESCEDADVPLPLEEACAGLSWL
jgi:hypothetical protein